MDEGRRRLLTVTVYAGAAALSAAVGVPVAAAVLSPLGKPAVRRGDGFLDVLGLGELREGAPVRVVLRGERSDAWTTARNEELGAAWLVRRGDEVVAFSTECPHLGCAVDHEKGKGFTCPCHDSLFADDGARVSGPSDRGLYTLAAKVEDGRVLVRLA